MYHLRPIPPAGARPQTPYPSPTSLLFKLALEMNSGFKNKKIGFNPKSVRPYLRILCVVDDSIETIYFHTNNNLQSLNSISSYGSYNMFIVYVPR